MYEEVIIMKMLKVIAFICWTTYAGIMFYTYFIGNQVKPSWGEILVMSASMVIFSFGEIVEELFKEDKKN